MSTFQSGRSGKGAAFVSDREGSLHALAMRRSARVLAPLALLAIWYVVGLVGKSYEAARAEIARPLPAMALIAFILVVAYHARLGMDNIIEDYVHDKSLKATALLINKWLTVAIAAVWTLAIMIIAAPR